MQTKITPATDGDARQRRRRQSSKGRQVQTGELDGLVTWLGDTPPQPGSLGGGQVLAEVCNTDTIGSF